MTRYKVNSGETVTTPFALTLGDTLYVAATGLVQQAGSTTAVTFSGRTFIRNLGGIEPQGAGVAISGSVDAGFDATILNEAGATIKGGAGAIKLTAANGANAFVELRNAGTIDGGSSRAIDFKDLRTDDITILNQENGVITNAGTADVIRPGYDGGSDPANTRSITILNEGVIRAGVVAGATSGGDGIDFQSVAGYTTTLSYVVNYATGTIEGGKHGITGANAAVIVNEAGGLIIGRNGSGLNFDTEIGDGYVVVENRGLISGRYDGYGDGDGDGVDVDFVVRIQNYGTIEGTGADNLDDFADGIAAGGGFIRNLSDGVISGQNFGILIDDGNFNGGYAATKVINSGAVTGFTGIQLIGDFDDTIVNRGTITSTAIVAVDPGAGNDRVVNSGVVTGVVALGAGDDVFVSLAGAQSSQISGGDGQDRIGGSTANETITGGAGQDVMAGGGGDDTFVFWQYDSSRVDGPDRIVDFAAGDTIDLTAIDADVTDGFVVNDAFTFIGTAAFSNTAGELRIEQNATTTTLLGDTDGDHAAEFVLVFEGVIDPAVIAAAIGL